MGQLFRASWALSAQLLGQRGEAGKVGEEDSGRTCFCMRGRDLGRVAGEIAKHESRKVAGKSFGTTRTIVSWAQDHQAPAISGVESGKHTADVVAPPLDELDEPPLRRYSQWVTAHRPACCSAPPHILQRLARAIDPGVSQRALTALGFSAQAARLRTELVSAPPLPQLPSPNGGRYREVYDVRHRTPRELP